MAKRTQEGHLVGVPGLGDGLAGARTLHAIDDPVAAGVHDAVAHYPHQKGQLGQVDEGQKIDFNNTVKAAENARLKLAVARPVDGVGGAGELWRLANLASARLGARGPTGHGLLLAPLLCLLRAQVAILPTKLAKLSTKMAVVPLIDAKVGVPGAVMAL